jgi:DNA invertase Pin-like site-specific DNA recombinase
MKALGYIRVSTADQSTSLEVQTQKIQDYCKFRGIELTHIYTDEDVSGGKPFYQRAGGAEANNTLVNTDVKTIICVKPDRLFRSVKDALITVDDWSHEKVSLHIIDLGGNSIDTQTALGRTFFIQAITMAEFERNIAGERTKAVLKHKKDSGKAYCGAIYGFNNVDGKLIVNEKEIAVVSAIFNKRTDSKYSFGEIADYLNDMNVPSKTGKIFYASTIKAIIDNPIYQQYL